MEQRSSQSRTPSRNSNNSSYGRRKKSGRNSWKYKSKRNYGEYHSKNYGKNRRFQGAKIDPIKYIAKAQYSEETNITVSNARFSDFKLQETLSLNIQRKGYVHPTKIQEQTIPQIIRGKDVLGLASTGSGKTAAFLVPIINKAIKNRDERCLIIGPTRELADQIQKELETLTTGTNIRSVLIIGGASINKQISLLKHKPQFVIGTPGRMKDLSQRKVLHLSQFNNAILDEVDRMLDMGFIHDINELVSQMNPNKQSLFFSATMSAKAEEVARTFLKDPVKIQTEKQSPKKNVDQDIVRINNPEKKLDILHDLLIQDGFNKVLIFSRTKRGADKLSRKLVQRGFKANAIHGDKTQNRRLRTISDFRNDSINILIATDVASRGLDISDITHVINYDEPATYEDYIHRIGRTGRAGKKGTALTFVS